MAPCTGGFRKTNAYEQKQVNLLFTPVYLLINESFYLFFIARQIYNCSISVVYIGCEILFVYVAVFKCLRSEHKLQKYQVPQNQI